MPKWENLIKPEKVDFTQGWDSESDFDDWLVSEIGLEYLAELTGVELDPESIGQQENVGKFSADIFARDTDGKVVIIENQRYESNHDHLGKILTYAGGLSVDTAGCSLIWIAEKIREEHRSALDWLNSRTDSENSFFGIEIGLLKVGDRLMPEPRIVSEPNNWSRAEKKKASGEWRPTQRLRYDFWEELLDEFHKRKIQTYQNKHASTRDSWLSVGAGLTGCNFSLDFLQKEMRVGLYFQNSDEKKNRFLFEELHKDKTAIEEDFGKPLEWAVVLGKKHSSIKFVEKIDDGHNRENWDEIIDWMAEHMQKLETATRQRLLDAGGAWKS